MTRPRSPTPGRSGHFFSAARAVHADNFACATPGSTPVWGIFPVPTPGVGDNRRAATVGGRRNPRPTHLPPMRPHKTVRGSAWRVVGLCGAAPSPRPPSLVGLHSGANAILARLNPARGCTGTPKSRCTFRTVAGMCQRDSSRCGPRWIRTNHGHADASQSSKRVTPGAAGFYQVLLGPDR